MRSKSRLPATAVLSKAIPLGLGYVAGSSLPIAALAYLATPTAASGAIIVQYAFAGTTSTYSSPTTIDPNVTAPALNSDQGVRLTNGGTTAVTYGTGLSIAPDASVGGTTGWYTNNPGGNYLTVTLNSNSDSEQFIQFTVTANAGYVIDPTAIELVGGAGGSSNVRSAYIYDNVDGEPTAFANSSNTGTGISGGVLMASGSFTADRGAAGTGPGSTTPPTMNTFETSGTFPSGSDVNLTSFTVTVWFDAQGNVSKGIDIADLELDGTVVPVPEPATMSLIGAGGVFALSRRRRRNPAAGA